MSDDVDHVRRVAENIAARADADVEAVEADLENLIRYDVPIDEAARAVALQRGTSPTGRDVASERLADAVEELVEQQKVQNAVLAAQMHALQRLRLAQEGRPTDETRTLKSQAGMIHDWGITLEENVDTSEFGRWL